MAAIDITTLSPSGVKVPGNYAFGDEGIIGQGRFAWRFLDATVDSLLTANTYDILAIEPNTLVIGGFLLVRTVEGAADTVSVGDSGGATTILGATSLNSAVATAFTGRPFYASANKVRLSFSADITAAKFWIGLETVLLRS